MTRDDIIRMAREAGAFPELSDTPGKDVDFLRRFAALVCDYLLSTEIHSCHANCERFACVQTRKAVEAEREACAKVCESLKPTTRAYDHRFWDACHESAAAIRARGQE
jgi:hypothetical protein